MLAWSAVYFGGLLLIFLVMTATLGPEFLVIARKGGFLNDDLGNVSQMLAESLPAFFLVLVMSAGLWSIITGGVLRLVLRHDQHGFAHLRLGRDELRLTLANMLCIGVYVVSAIVGIVIAGALRPSGPLAMWLGAGTAVVFALWLGTRLSLLLPHVFVTGRISPGEAWEKTRGQFWPLLGMMVMAVIFYVMIWALFAMISFALVTISGGAQAMQDLTHISVITAITAIIGLVMQFLLQVLQIVMIYAPAAVAYQQIALTDSAATPGRSAAP